MLLSLRAWVVALLFRGVASVPVINLTSREDKNPCMQVRDDIKSASGDLPIVKPSLAYACLKDVPLDAGKDKQLLDFLRPGIEWQSTLRILTDPPEEYSKLSQGVDIAKGFEELRDKLDGGKYDNQYDFMRDLYMLLNIRPRDGHFNYNPALLDVFTFEPGVTFVSVGSSSTDRPKVFVYDDVKYDSDKYEASAVAEINGMKSSDFILHTTINSGILHDPDGRYGAYFRNPANDMWLRHRGPAVHKFEMADKTTAKFDNGTTRDYENIAFVKTSFDNISTGKDLQNQVEQGSQTVRLFDGYLLEIPEYGQQKGYPAPVALHPDNATAGYLFGDSDGDLSDVVVVALHSFASSMLNGTFDDGTSQNTKPELRTIELTAAYSKASADVISSTIKQGIDKGKKRLILDLQGNPGGFVYSLQLTYQILFPGAEFPWNYRARSTPQLDWLGTSAQKVLSSNLLSEADLPEEIRRMVPWPIGHNYMLNNENKNFDSFSSLFGPDEIAGGKYTVLAHDAPLDKKGAWPDLYGDWDNPFDESPFKLEDMVILTDGYCLSACALFVGALAREHGIRTIAVGGRDIEAPMQAVGGTKGGPASDAGVIGAFALLSTAFGITKPKDLDIVPSATDRPPIRNAVPSDSSIMFSMAVNLGNIYPSNGKTDNGLPVQFSYEAANCKLFYTWEMIRDVSALWKEVAKVAWGGGKCVKGSTVNDDGTMGNKVLGFDDKVKDTERLPVGPGSLKSDGGSGGGDGGEENFATLILANTWATFVAAMATGLLVMF